MKITSTKLKRLIKEEIGEELDEGFLGGLVDKLRGRSVENTEKLHDEIKKLLRTKEPGSVENLLKVRAMYKMNATATQLGLDTLLAVEEEFGEFLDGNTGKLKPMETKNFETISANILEKYKKGIENYNRAYKEWYGDGLSKEEKPAEDIERIERYRAANTPEQRAARRRQGDIDATTQRADREEKESSAELQRAYKSATTADAEEKRKSRKSTTTYDSGGRHTGFTRSQSTYEESLKITKTKLKRIIKEELTKILKGN
tara:strand:+ start:1331 stop:2107 length:777 start_codon:yes stop_codon:yes gene_type:complete